jgi:hypothetical protein
VEALRQTDQLPLPAVRVFASVHDDPDSLRVGVTGIIGTSPLFRGSIAGDVCNAVYSVGGAVAVPGSPHLSVRRSA